MIPPMQIRCDTDKGIENWRLTDFPFVPSVGDILIIDGVSFSVIGRELPAHHGRLCLDKIVVILDSKTG